MARSLSLAAYMALARRTPRERPAYQTKRPTGELVWAHATSPDTIPALQHLCCRLATQRAGLHFLITATENSPEPQTLDSKVIWLEVPEETTAHVQAFLGHWQPDICLWTQGHLRPALVTCTAEQDIPMFLINAEVEGFEDARWRWLPDMSRAVLGHFSSILAASANSAKRLQRLGVQIEKITVSGPLQDGGIALPYTPSDREELATTLAGRPIWLAANVHMDELDIVISAHKSASRLAHRLLLIIVPDSQADANVMHQSLRLDGWRVAQWTNGDYPDENTQILLADTTGEMGLWYRLSPTSFLAESLNSKHRGIDPYPAAALGSAILYGPHVGNYLPAYSRLAKAGAARLVRDGQTLGAAVSRLIAPDHAASMAHSAWEVVSLGAEATDMVIDLVNETLDLQGAG